MGPRKRNLRPRSKPPRTADNAAKDGGVSPNAHLSDALSQEQSKNEPLAPSDYASIKLECQRALNTFGRGNHAKALRLMKETLLRHENCGLVHRVQADLHVLVASLIDDNAVKKQHLKNAVESAHRAVTLLPNSIEFAAFYAYMLYEASNDDEGYAEVVRVCERALSIDNPIDPADEFLQEDSRSKDSTAEDRIADVRKELHSLVQKSRGASLSTSTKNLGDGGREKFGSMPLKPLTDVPMKVKSAGTGQRNEMQKAVMTLEERRREIEVKVAAAKLLQVKSDSTQEEDDDERAFNMNPENRLGERRKLSQLKRIVTSAKRRNQFQSYWDSMSEEKKWGLLEVRIGDLRRHLRSFKGGSVAKIFSEAMGFAQKNKTWKFWACFFCDEKFINSELRVQHLEQEHKWNVEQKLKELPAIEIDADLVDMLVNHTWKPVDIPRAMKIIHNQSKCQLANLADEACMQRYVDGNECCPNKDDNNSSCQEDKDHFSYEEPNKTLVCSGSESRNNDDISEFSLDESDGKLLPMACPYGQKWPLCDNIERTEFLENIQRDVQLLLKHKFLTKELLNKVVDYAIAELKKIVPASQLSIHGLDQSPLCFCFLEPTQLKSVHSYLGELSRLCGINMNPDKDHSTFYHKENWNGIKEQIVFIGDSSCLHLEDHLLRVKLPPYKHQDSVADDGSAEAGTICRGEVALPPDSDALIYWLFDGPSIGEDLALWTHLQNDKKRRGKEIGRMFNEELNSFQSLCRKQSELARHNEELLAIQSIWTQELEKREQVTNHVPQSYVSLLRRRHRELVGAENNAMSCSKKIELDEISSILVKESSYKSSDLSSSVHADDCLKIAIQRQIEQLYAELSKINTAITRVGGVLRQFGDKYEKVAYLDYQGIMLPLLKSFIQAKFEALVNEDAKQKSEAFLSELSLDAKKNTSKAGNHTKLPKEKSKAKKKKKYYRKMKDPKATCGDEPHVQGENAEQAHFPLGYDGDNPSSEFVVAISADALKQKEEALKHKLEQELEELKLEEMLERQRRIEDEAKQRHLAKQNKKVVALIPENLEKMTAISSMSSDDSGPGICLELRYCEPLSPNHVPLDYDGDNPSSEFIVPTTADELKLKEEELKHKVEHGVEELIIEDMLEHQRRSEDEAKQKHLAEQSKKAVALIPEKSEKMVTVSSMLSDDSGPGVCEELSYCKPLSSSQFPLGNDGDNPSSEFVGPTTADELKLKEHELENKIEHKVEKLKLEEMLEHQRWSEDEARQKHLAEQNKKAVAPIPENSEKMVAVSSILSDDSGQRVCEDLRYCEPLSSSHFPLGYDGDNPSSDVAAASDDELKLKEEDLKHKIEHEVEEFILDEMLEYQRRSEDEAKQKHLADQNKKALAPIPESLEKMVAVSSMLSDDSGSGVCDELRHCKPVTLPNGNRSLDGWNRKDIVASHHQVPVPIHNENADLHDSPEICVGSVLLNLGSRRTASDKEMAPQIPLVSSTLEVFSGAPARTLEETEVPSNSCQASASYDKASQDAVSSAEDLTLVSTDVGEYNCILNVIVQSLWHLRKFRDEFLCRSTYVHVHIGYPCVVCALLEIFNALSMQREAVSPTSLRIALSMLYRDSNFFQEINGASEVLEVIFDCLHRSFTSGSSVSNTVSSGSKCIGYWDCASDACIAHKLFGMDKLEIMICNKCGLESRHFKYTSFFYDINENALRTMKVLHAKRPFDELLKLVEINYQLQLACDPDVEGCGKYNKLHNILSTPPHVFITVLCQQSANEKIYKISETLTALSTEIDIGVLYEGVDAGNVHSLISMVCYYGRHYICFAYCQEQDKWIIHDDETMKIIGCWDDVLSMCERRILQPHLLFFEAVK